LVRLKFDYDGGGIGKGGMATLFVDEKQLAQKHIPQTLMVRFSLDETFDVGEDTGTPVIEDYVDKMPYAFTGALKKLVVVLEPENLTPEQREQLRREAARAMMAVH
jgi:arylsulfatase